LKDDDEKIVINICPICKQPVNVFDKAKELWEEESDELSGKD